MEPDRVGWIPRAAVAATCSVAWCGTLFALSRRRAACCRCDRRSARAPLERVRPLSASSTLGQIALIVPNAIQNAMCCFPVVVARPVPRTSAALDASRRVFPAVVG